MSVQLWICWLMFAAAARGDVGERLTMDLIPIASSARMVPPGQSAEEVHRRNGQRPVVANVERLRR